MLVHRLTCTHSFKTHSSLPVLATPWKSNTWVGCNPQIQGKDKTNCHQFCIELLPFQCKSGLTWMLPLFVLYLHTDIEVFSLSHRKFRYFQTDICSTSIKQVLCQLSWHTTYTNLWISPKNSWMCLKQELLPCVHGNPPPPPLPQFTNPPLSPHVPKYCKSLLFWSTLTILHWAIQLNWYC